jgi:hypothetical protein
MRRLFGLRHGYEYIDIGIYGLQGVLLKCETIVMILAHVVSFSRVSYALKQSAQGNIT